MNIAEILHKQVEETPETPAILEMRRGARGRVSFADLELRARRGVTLLRQKGVQTGDTVLLMMPLSTDFYVALIAIFRLGAIALILDSDAKSDEVDRACTLCRPKAIITTTKNLIGRFFSRAFRKIALKFTIGFSLPPLISWQKSQTLETDPKITEIEPQTPALIVSTVGLYDQFKFIELTHHYLGVQQKSLGEILLLHPGEIDITLQPLLGLINLGLGVTSLLPKFQTQKPLMTQIKPIIDAINKYQPTRIVAAPTLLENLIEALLKKRELLTSLYKIFIWGTPVLPSRLNQVNQIAPQAEIIAIYGETAAIASLSRREIEVSDVSQMQTGKGLLVGKPAPDIQLRIISNQWGAPVVPYQNQAEFEATCRPYSEPGEIVLQGDRFLTRTLNELGDEPMNFRVGDQQWHRTGDAGYLDSQGRLWLLGPCQDCIQDKFGVIYPLTVECAVDYNREVQRIAFFSYRYQRTLVVEMADQSGDRTLFQRSLSSVLESLQWANVEALRVVEKIPMDKRYPRRVDRVALERMLDEQD
ncbi:AMP-binding protein [Laspinema olomoucense]|uniref:AMP-binding protein n=1 Tax=Laspinema olomoucense D3b TaxID=2953688 RepID=A0ABT2N9A0_9CYAN|nr:MULTISPECIES: AMP-binding protein [unclassified Laspinema]MCT7979257.1 AMP-binding protein [Laspinema sp. D3b]MCT7988125.1 AMP-binding protein [Laspinema sp. D3a]